MGRVSHNKMSTERDFFRIFYSKKKHVKLKVLEPIILRKNMSSGRDLSQIFYVTKDRASSRAA